MSIILHFELINIVLLCNLREIAVSRLYLSRHDMQTEVTENHVQFLPLNLMQSLCRQLYSTKGFYVLRCGII